MSPIVRLDNLTQFAAVNLSSDPGHIRGAKVMDHVNEITLVWNMADGKLAHNVLHGQYTGSFAGTQAQANGILTGLTTGAQWTNLALFLANTCALTAVTFRDLNVKDQPLIQSTVAGKNGTSASPEMPNEVSAVITLRTAQTGRQNRGRMFIPGWATNALQTGNVIADAAVTALNAWASIIAGVFSANGGYVFGVGHVARAEYTSNNGTHHDARASGLVPITTIGAKDNHWDTQRRRGLR